MFFKLNAKSKPPCYQGLKAKAIFKPIFFADSEPRAYSFYQQRRPLPL